MARTSKTKIGDSGESSDRMMRAAASGAEAVSQARGQLLGQYREGAENARNLSQTASSLVQQHEDRQTQKEQFASKMELESAQMAQQESQFSRGLQQRESETELEAAKSGFEPNQGGQDEGAQGGAMAGAQAGAEGGARAAQLEAEMAKGQGQPKIGALEPDAQQRLSETTKQPLEMDSQGRWRPTAERKSAQERAQKREDFQAETERIRARAYEQQVSVAAQKALMAGDMEAYEEHAQILANVPNDRQKQYDRLMTGKVSESDWSDIAKEAADNPEPGLAEDIKAQNFSPRVQAFMRTQVGKGSLKAIVGSLGDTTKLKIDWTNPVMVQFQQMVQTDAGFMRANPALGQLGFIQSTDDKMRFLNVMAAAKIMTGMGRAPRGKASGGMVPATEGGGGASAGGAPAELPPGSTQVPGRSEGAAAVRGARAGGASPQEALRAGQRVSPTGREPEFPRGGGFGPR
jgi:hypothetical protein